MEQNLVLEQDPAVQQDLAIAELNQKIDNLTEQVTFLSEVARQQQLRQREWDELKADLSPIANDMYMVAVEQLQEIEPHVQIEDLLHLVKRLARNTNNIENMLDQLESLSDFVQDASPIANEAFLSLVEELDEMERKGYFRLIREAQYVLDNIAEAFGPEDVRQLGDNVVTILTTVKEMTQPEVMNTVQHLAGTMREMEADPDKIETSTWSILKQLRDPQVRRGMATTLEMLKAVGED
ncbi:MAG: DUF1641 domain-containing protein [Chloroflexota bacterium]|nr:DUF1641 domain-containing protein [Chloroflexota bacterium]